MRLMEGRRCSILTGSQNLAISHGLSQSLAGRAAILHLLPLSSDEVRQFPTAPTELFELLWTGSYPRIYDRGIPAQQWLADYVATYVQRDVRQILNVGDLNRFNTFLRLCAAHTAQELKLSTLGADAGVSHNTAGAWLSVLESSFLVFRLPAWHRNIKNQIVKIPKLHFFDSGLVCYLLGIREPSQLRHHPLRGAVFESWVIAERYKKQIHQGREPQMFHFRESRGVEVDLLEVDGAAARLVEIKSAETIAGDFFKGLHQFAQVLVDGKMFQVVEKEVVYGGSQALTREGVKVIPWKLVSG